MLCQFKQVVISMLASIWLLTLILVSALLILTVQEDKYKEHRREKRRERKRKGKADDDEEEEEGVDPEMAAMMGFSGFGTKRKAT